MKKKFFVIERIGGHKFYVSDTYAGRVLSSEKMINTKYFASKEEAKKYMEKCKIIASHGDFSIGEIGIKPKTHKIVTKAIELKAKGIMYIASIVKSYRGTSYYHLNRCDDIIRAGKWIPAPRGQYGNWHGRCGVSGRKIDWDITVKKATLN